MLIKQQRVLLLVPPHPQAFRQISQRSRIYPIIYITAWDGLDCVERRVTEKHHTQDHNTMTRPVAYTQAINPEFKADHKSFRLPS